MPGGGPLRRRRRAARLREAARQRRARLGHPVAADALAPEGLLELGEQRRRRPARRRPRPGARSTGHARARDGWSSTRRAMAGTRNSRRDPLRLDQPQHLAGVEAGEQHVHAAEAGEEVRGAPAVDVEERDRVEDDVLARSAPS